jgi:predicted CoA-substrate-specific enzyme activase
MTDTYRAGIDIGSTTVKVAITDNNGELVFGRYQRHFAHIQETLAELLEGAREVIGEARILPMVTGSGSINLAKILNIGFVQEVVAVATALESAAPRTDVAVELGGEDAKIIYFTGGLEQRMNGVCAGGTGSFIDQMAALLQTDASGLNEHAKSYEQIYPIAARCGVFAKTDIQPLINEGATISDLSASIFQAVVNQTISGLACGKPIRGNVAFLGGPLHFLTELKAAFIRTLRLTEDQVIDPENSHLFAAIGAAMNADKAEPVAVGSLIDRLRSGITMSFELKRLDPLFKDQAEYDEFSARHGRHRAARKELADYKGDCFLGIDAGSTTTKLALIGENGELLWSYYSNNNGSPVQTAIDAMGKLSAVMPEGVKIRRSCSTGYGEALLKSAFILDEGEVETIAHYYAAAFFDPEVDCVLDIGGQDMKCIKIKNNSVDNIMLNEACSSGCGSFIENFAESLGYTAPEFAKEAVFARNPIDLGTRCTVFMNSNVKQAQKEGATVQDISAGLAYSVIKNALFKVIKLTDAASLGSHIIVQGGTFHNQAVLRAFEKISGAEVICPDIAGIMGAFGAALIAKEHYTGSESTILSFEDIAALTFKTATTRCKGCSNRCMLTINTFPGGRRHITGNRCEKGLTGGKKRNDVPNLMAYKLTRMFDYEPLDKDTAPRGVIGIPRVLNIYENYPFWAVFFRELGYSVVLSPESDRKIYELGIESIPSESECYPAKLAHGHVQWLIDNGVETIFHPSVFYEYKETEDAQNNFNCPMVIGYPENLKNNVEAITDGKVRFLRPFISFANESVAEKRLVKFCRDDLGIPAGEVRAACRLAWAEMRKCKDDIKAEGSRALHWMEERGGRGIVLAGRPYHVDPEINHGIPELITSYGLVVLTEDSINPDFKPERPVRVNDQWVFHSRLYTAAEFIRNRDDLEIIQLNSFGCGLDAVTTDQVSEILEGSGKLYTLLKIDEVNNLGAARIRVRSLIAAMNMRRDRGIVPEPKPAAYNRTIFTEQMHDERWTILAPQMSPIHFDLLQPVFNKHGYNIEILKNDNRNAIDTGLRYVNNDACFPSLIVVGQIMDAILSGKYDTDHLAVMMTQTGGCCRASNYVAFIRRALDKAGLSHIPVISLNANGMETNPGFKITLPMIVDAGYSIVLGDLLMKCLYRVRPYELVPGSANELHEKLRDRCLEVLTDGRISSRAKVSEMCNEIVRAFDELPIHEDMRKPRVGIVGEILVKYMPLANNYLVDLLEHEGAEAEVPGLIDFLLYSTYNSNYKYEFLGGKRRSKTIANTTIKLIEWLRAPANRALEASRRFEPTLPIEQIAEYARPYISIGNQYGEGWFLTGEMVELIHTGAPNIVCIQPFACLPNHVVGKGVIKALRTTFPQANIVAVDYDPGASEVNQLNRIKLMLSAAVKNMEAEESPNEKRAPEKELAAAR